MFEDSLASVRGPSPAVVTGPMNVFAPDVSAYLMVDMLRRHDEELRCRVQLLQQQTQQNERNELLKRKLYFALFLKILFTRLQRDGNHLLRDTAKTFVQVCTEQNKKSGGNSTSLLESIEGPLREIVGEEYWIRSHQYMQYYIASRKPRSLSSSSSMSATPRRRSRLQDIFWIFSVRGTWIGGSEEGRGEFWGLFDLIPASRGVYKPKMGTTTKIETLFKYLSVNKYSIFLKKENYLNKWINFVDKITFSICFFVLRFV